ncbi:MAG: 50S ribosomal protein L11 methyltransferase [Oscillospiraceae bacterium]|nr:50S ribosomal protein L11 methyltransferase [Oscillospiraceae bacterium]
MEFIKLNIYTQSQELETLMTRLEDLGVSGFEIHDAADFNSFLENGMKGGNGFSDLAAWDYVGEELEPLKTQETHLTLYLTTDEQGKELLDKVYVLCADLRIDKSVVREEDWADCWKEYFKPFKVGERFLIKPTWENAPETERLILEIDPASAFGTGQHESTRLCIEMLEGVIGSECTLLDIGCGSGILAIGALILGADSVVMIDVSENAVKVARDNAIQNGFMDDRFTALCGDITKSAELLKQIGEEFDVVTANIVADVIINMSGLFPQFLKEGGVLITSGIIEERLEEVITALEASDGRDSSKLKITEIRKDSGWCAVKAVKSAD